jgi:hypothetical protein
LRFNPDLIRVHLPQVAGLFDQLCMHCLAMLPSRGLDALHGALIPLIRGHNRLYRAPMGQQCDHDAQCVMILVRAIERRAFRFRKCLVTHVADIPPFLLAVHADITFADLPTCHTRHIRAKYFLRVHWLLVLFHTQIVPVDPFFANSPIHHGLLQCYL